MIVPENKGWLHSNLHQQGGHSNITGIGAQRKELSAVSPSTTTTTTVETTDTISETQKWVKNLSGVPLILSAGFIAGTWSRLCSDPQALPLWGLHSGY